MVKKRYRPKLAGLLICAAFGTLFSGCVRAVIDESSNSLVYGRVVLEDAPGTGARVGAYSSPDFRNQKPEVTAVSDKDGYYSLELEQGKYYLAVYNPSEGYFAYSGLNPVHPGKGTRLQIGFRAEYFKDWRYIKNDEGIASVTGRLTAGGEPLAGGRVFMYLDAAEDFRGPGYAFSQPTDGHGRFFIEDITPGTYYLIGRKRFDGGLVGPVDSGDFFGYFPYNPVEIRAGQTLEVEISCIAKKKENFPSSGATVIQGTISDRENRPVSGVYIFAYTEEVVGHKMPAATSAVTGPDGMYSMSLPEGGKYFIGAREKYGINPQPGEFYGLYPGTPDHSVVVAEGGKLSGVNIIVEKILGWEN